MTFEDFFIKKRIDLLQLQEAEPLLYKEFKRHFELMGEKSFDHTKKFWFNRLRKSFHLKEEVSISKPLPAPSSTEEHKTIAPEETQAAKPTGFKPRFKAVKSQESDGDKASQKEEKSPDERTVVPESTLQKPVGFKPRFKPGKSSSAETESSSSKEVGQEDASNKTKNPTDEPTAINKPSGFKPRFKAGVTKGADTQSINQPSPSEQAQLPSEKTEPDNDVSAPSLEETKPLGFKPRFKAGITNKKTSNEEKIEEDLQKKSETVAPSKENTTSAGGKEAQTPQKPMGFKPRFKAGVTKKVTPDEENASTISPKEATIEIKTAEEKSSLQDEINPTAEDEDKAASSNTPPSSTKAPLGFKPRFKPKKKEE